MSIHSVISIDSNEWNEILKDIEHSFSHTRENCFAMSLTTGYKTFLYVFEKDGIRIVCPIAEREFKGNKDIVTPYGFSGFTGNGIHPEFKEYWKEFTREKKYVCGYISMNPLFEKKEYFNAEEEFSSTNLYFINLNLSLTELYENLDTNRRRVIKNFRKTESGFIYDKKKLTEYFISNYYNFLDSINSSAAGYFKTETLEYLCSLENVFMTGAVEDDKIVAVYIFAHTKYSADCLFNVPLPEGRKYAPTLLWAGLKHFKNKKIPVLNLGGGLKDDDNVALSKERFGAYKLPFVNLKQIYNKKLYNSLCQESGNDSEKLNGYFPAYRKI